MSIPVSNSCCEPQSLKLNNSTGYLSISDGNSVYLGTIIKALGISTPVIDFTLGGFILTLTYTDAGGVIQHKNVDLSALAQGGSFSVADTPTTHLVYTNGVLTANVNISTATNNSILAKTDGIWAPNFTETILTTTDSPSIAFTTSGVDGHNVSGSVKISQTVGNKIQIASDGLLVNDMTTYLLAGTNITLSGSGTASSPYIITAGGFSQVPLSVNDSSSFHFISSGTSGMTLSGNVKVSGSTANALIVNADGLYVPQASTNSYSDVQARAAISAIAPLLYNNTTGVMSLAQATSSTSGYLANADWLTFNGKISTGASIGTASSVPVYAGQNGTTLNFNGLRAGTNVTLNQSGNDIVINASSSGGGTPSSVFSIDFIVGDGGALTPTANASQFNPSSNPLAGKTILGFWVEGIKTAGVPRTGGELYFTFSQSVGTITLTNGVFSLDTYYSILYK